MGSFCKHMSNMKVESPMITDGEFTTPLVTCSTEWLGLYVFVYFLSSFYRTTRQAEEDDKLIPRDQIFHRWRRR